jgi:hypothetical protein
MSLPDFKVIISDGGYDMVLDASPDSFSESRSVNWSPYDIVHTPVQILGYGGSSSRTISLSAKLISRTAKEAKINKNRIQTIRYWAVNDFGAGNTGAPPPVLRLKAFKNTFPEMQCYLTNYSIEYPSDVDWIPTTEGDPFPVVMTVAMGFIECYTPLQMRNFNRFNLKGAPYQTERIGFGKGGCGIGGVGKGSEIVQMIDMKAIDGVTGVVANTSDSSSAVINNGVNEVAAAKQESFADAVAKAREKTTPQAGSLYTKAQKLAMSNNFVSLPDLTKGVSDYSDTLSKYSGNLKSVLYKKPATSVVNTKNEDVNTLISTEPDLREDKNG